MGCACAQWICQEVSESLKPVGGKGDGVIAATTKQLRYCVMLLAEDR